MPFQITRRGLIAAAPVALAARPALRQGLQSIAYVGTYTPSGQGIYRYRLDPLTGAMSRLGPATEMRNPTWLVVDPRRRLLFASSEVEDYGPGRTGAVAAFLIRLGDGTLTPINTVSSGGPGPAHISLHPSGRFLFVANYTGGSVAVLRVAPDGALSEPHQVEQLTQPPGFSASESLSAANLAVSDHSKPHMHMVQADPSGRWVLADDAGSDRICIWRFDEVSGRLTPSAVPFTPTPPGSAPRHFAFDPSGRLLFDLQEHDAALVAYRFEPATGGLNRLGSQSTLPAGFAGSDVASELCLSADGRFLYAGNRLRNSITTFAVGPAGEMRKLAETWTQSDYPRSFALDPSGRLLICCNQRGDNLTSFHVDPRTGALSFTGRFEPVGSPAAVAFFNG